MNSQEHPLLHRIQLVLDAIANMEPSNPCDTARKFIAGDLACKASRELYYAIGDIGFRDYPAAEERIEAAEKIVAQRNEKVAELEQRLQEQLKRRLQERQQASLTE